MENGKLKMRRRLLLQLYLLLVLSSSLITLHAQQRTSDSLLRLIKTDKEDTNKANHLNKVAWAWRVNNPDSAQLFAQQAMDLSKRLSFNKGMADAYKTFGAVKQSKGEFPQALDLLQKALDIYTPLHDDKSIASVYNNIGIGYESTGDYNKSLAFHTKALDIRKKLNDKSGMAASYSNIGNIYYDQGNYPDALNSDLKALSIDQELNDSSGVASDYGNIGNLYIRLNDNNKAVDYYTKALEMNTKLNDKNGIAIDLYNIALVYSNQHKYKEALQYHFKCLQLKLGIKDSAGIAFSYSGIGAIYGYMHNFDSAINYELRSLKIRTQIGDKAGMVSSYGDLGESYKHIGHFPESEVYLQKCEQLAKEINDKEDLKQTYLLLASLYDTTKRFQQAFEYFKRYGDLKDSLVNQDKSKEIGKLEAKSDYDKQLALQQADADKQAELSAIDSKKKQITIFFIGAIALAVAVIAVIILRSLRVTRKQKALIESQKAVVEEQKVLVEQQKAIVDEKNKDITDSIHYASRIQQALLTSEDYIGKYLKDYFILFKPRDIVSGDFYWANEAGDSSFLICAGDCTGHGVPGAFMSLLNISMLNETTLEKKIYSPEKILDDVRHHIIKALNPDGSDKGKDGMDCVLISLSTSPTPPKEGLNIDLPSGGRGAKTLLQFACANNPLWIISDPLGERKITEYTPDKMPVGMQTGSEKPFTLHSVELKRGDCVYIFTDGFADQFGGPKGKKFKYKQLQELMQANAHKQMKSQKEALSKTFESWKGELEQIDDVLVIGIRL